MPAPIRRAGSRCCRLPPWSSTGRTCRSGSTPSSPKPIWRACTRSCPRKLPVTFLPIQRIGVSVEHLAFPGTLTLSAAAAIAAWTEIGDSLARAGLRKLVLDHQPRRQCRRHGTGGARSSRPPRHAGGDRRLASLRLSGEHVHQRRETPRHSWRRHRDLADARRPTRNRAPRTRPQRHRRRPSRWHRSSSGSAPIGRPASPG